ncbi:hypothetical protein [Nocardioides insulae]|uniref:hypothetical protein n=1 Tax=Nocardioides insulae TaxID=394734 RepID=UPI00040F4A08|nr:hypothetical protein [Nocardioides insulae]
MPWVTGALVLALLAIGGVWWLRDEEYVEPEPVTSAADPAAARATLSDLMRDLRQRDPEAAATLGADRAARVQLSAMAANADTLDLVDLSARYVTVSGTVAPDGGWHAVVELTYRLEHYDPTPAEVEVEVAFAPGAGRSALIEHVGGRAAHTPLWTTGELEVRRTPQTLVMVHGDAARADDYARRVRASVPTVREVVSWKRPRLVLEVPETVTEFERLLEAEPGSYDGVAAVSASVDGSTDPQGPVHVLANPALFASLEGAGAQLVLDHEATHVATGATHAGNLPLWLSEGFADYVALHDVDLPVATTAGGILAQVRRSGPPDALPDEQDFDAGSDAFGTAYESAWLACRLIADLGGREALVELYQRVQRGEPLARVLPEVIDLDLDGLTERWQRELRDLADE